MTNGWQIQAVNGEQAQTTSVEQPSDVVDEPITLEEEWVAEEIDEVESGVRRRWIDWLVPSTAIIAMSAWTGFFGWAFREDILAGGSPEQWIGWTINWSVPMLLISVFWLLSMRNSRREAERFGDTAQMLRRESEALEARLTVVNRELSLARDFLGSQSRELDALGRVATDKISTHAEALQNLIQDNGAQVDAIASVSDTALSNMEKLRDELPVISNSARDVSNQIGQAGRTAQEQLGQLVSGFQRLNDFGMASEKQVSALQQSIAATLTKFGDQLDTVEQAAQARFAMLETKGEEFRVEWDGREVKALAAMRKRTDDVRHAIATMADELADKETAQLGHLESRLEILREENDSIARKFAADHNQAMTDLRYRKNTFESELSEAIGKLEALDKQVVGASRKRITALNEEAAKFDGQLTARNAKFMEDVAKFQEEFETREAQTSELLRQRLGQLDDIVSERTQAQSDRIEKIVTQGNEISSKMTELGALLETIESKSVSTREMVDEGLGTFNSKLSAARDELGDTGQSLNDLTETGVRLLEIIQSGASECRDALPQAISQAVGELQGIEAQAISLKGNIDAVHERSAGLSDYVIAARDTLSEADGAIDAFNDKMNESSGENLTRISNLRGALSGLESESERVAAKANQELTDAIGGLEEAAKRAFTAIEMDTGEQLQALAKEIGAKASASIEQSLRAESEDAIERLEEASARSSEGAIETTKQLRDQLTKVNELAGNLEERVSRAREKAQEQVDSDFARRMALITESLNSNAIDIAKGLSEEVSDTAWAAYLKGDRGIFARKTVRLLSNVEAREIMDLYESDHAFRENVSRYIHDFEGMLRNVLSTRDGNALGVTLLSSDIGKLYVALAQSIERLRE